MGNNLPVLTLFVKLWYTRRHMLKNNRKSFFIRLGVISSILSVGMLFLKPPQFVGSFFAGCVAMGLNFYILFSLMDGLLDQNNPKHTTYLMMLLGKFLGLGLVAFLLVRFTHLDLLAFGLGFFIVAISATYATGKQQNQIKQQDQ